MLWEGTMIRWAKLDKPNCLVCSDGRIFAFRRAKTDSFYKDQFNGSIEELHQKKNNIGYMVVTVGGKLERVHRLVAKAFLGECPEGLEVDHIDNNSINNDISNLQYITGADNRRKRPYVTNSMKARGYYRTTRNGKYCRLPNTERIRK